MSASTQTDPDRWQVKVERVGEDRRPVLVIDNFLADPDALVAEAREGDFQKIAPFYPGLRARVRINWREDIDAALAPHLATLFDYPDRFRLNEQFYSIVTTKPEDLVPMQRMPHMDGVDDHKLALLVYLCQPEDGGTAFYRHRTTGFEYVSDGRFQAYRDAIYADVDTHGKPPADYPRGSDKMFEQTAKLDAAYNRAVIYSGLNLHAVDIPQDFGFSRDPDQWRLTLNCFLIPA